jgi:hypothetical protein
LGLGQINQKIIKNKLKVVPDTNQGIKTMEENIQKETINFPITLYYIFNSTHSHFIEVDYKPVTIKDQTEYDNYKNCLLVKDKATAKNIVELLKIIFHIVKI